MSKRDLSNFIDQSNWTASIFGGTVYDIDNLTQSDVDELCAKINNQLSPENLTCDGEASPTMVRNKYNMLAGSLKQLHGMGFTVTVEEL